MGSFDDAQTLLLNTLEAWDFSPAFPLQYSGDRGCDIVPAWPYDLLDNLQTFTNGQMTKPIISVSLVNARDSFRSFGSVMGLGSGTTTRYATRAEVAFSIICWADQQLGGKATSQALASQVEGCCFYNRQRLGTFVGLHVILSREGFEDRSQLWHTEVVVQGTAMPSYDA